jgi:hypothetical protein
MKYKYTVPEVAPHAPIYFLMFTSGKWSESLRRFLVSFWRKPFIELTRFGFFL